MAKPYRERDMIRTLSLMGSGFWVYFTAVLINAAVLGFSFNLVLAFIQKDVLDAAVNGQQALLIRALTLAAVTFLTGVPMLIGTRYVIALFEKKALTGARVRTFRQIVNLPISRFDQAHSADLVSRCTNDLGTLAQVYSRHVPSLSFGLMLGLVGIISVLILNWQMGLLALTLGFLTTLFSTTIAKPLREKSNAIQKHLSTLTEKLSDLLQSLQVSKMFHLEDITHQHYAQANQDMTLAMIDHASTQAVYDAIDACIRWMRSIGTLILGLYLFSRGSVGLGAVVAAIHLQSNASFMFTNLGSFVTGIQRSLAGSARVFELLTWPDERTTSTQASVESLTGPPVDAVIQVRDLSFRYESSDQSRELTLKNINLSVSQGQFVALVGPSGCGKSTLFKILMGLYPVKDGVVAIQGQSISAYPLEALRGLMAYVPQDAYLFDGSIQENILYGRPEAGEEDVIACAKSAYAHAFIMEQPEGYATLVGERGARLSGGQRQRIAIARALLKDAPILLLDEATSALDSESEALVQKALATLMRGRTTVAIAHRLSSIQHADTIVMMESGRILDQGTHAELLTRSVKYKNLYTMQAKAAI